MFNRMPFGISNGPSFFSQLVDKLFADIKLTYVLPFIDDFTIHSTNFEQHLIHLEDVLQRISAAGLKLKPSKCVFGADKVLFLGHELSAAGVGPNSKKIEAIVRMPPPSTLKELRSFLGMTSYYRRFIKDYAAVAESLYYLNKKGAVFEWTDKQQFSFDELKKRLISTPVLHHFDPKNAVEIHTDSSIVGLGAVLIQRDGENEFVVAYASRTLNKAERNYGITNLELLAVVFGVEKFSFYISSNRQFKIVTDHAAIGPLLKTKNPAGRLVRWILRLSIYNFVVVYRSGKDNVVTDALSRLPVGKSVQPLEPQSFTSVLVMQTVSVAELRMGDPFCSHILAALTAAQPSKRQRAKALLYFVLNDILYRRVFRDNKEHA